MITALDDQVGRIVAALDKKGLRDNTIILFASDNGGVTNALFATGARSEAERKESGGVALGEKPPASNGPYRAGKGSLYEGGVRVPAFANWPGRLKPAVVDAPVHMVDVMPTLLALAGGKGADDHPFDGKNVWPTLAEGKPSPHDEILINVEAIRGAIRKGDWKLVRMATFPGKTELFNLADDPSEKNNLADQHPEIVGALNARLLEYARADEAERVDQGAAGVPGRAGRIGVRSRFRHRRRRPSPREGGTAGESGTVSAGDAGLEC